MNLRHLWNRWLYLRRILDRLALPLGIVGLAAVAAYNWRQWQRDKEQLAQLGPAPPLPPLEEWPQLPLISVLVAAWNEAQCIERHIESFLGLSYPNKELVLCAGGTDGTLGFTKKYESTSVRILEQLPGEGKQRALEKALPVALGDLIYLTDADCILNDDVFERTVWPIVAGDGVAVTGTSRPIYESTNDPFVHYQWTPQRYRELTDTSSESQGLLGRNCAVTRSVLTEAWSANYTIPTGTDYYLALRIRQLGHAIQRVQASNIESQYPTTVAAYIRQRSRWLRNLFILGYRFRDNSQVYHAMQAMLTGVAFLLMPLLPIFVGYLGLWIWAVAWLFVGLTRFRYIHCVQTSESGETIGIGILFSLDLWRVLVADFVSWTRPLVDMWCKERREQW